MKRVRECERVASMIAPQPFVLVMEVNVVFKSETETYKEESSVGVEKERREWD